MAVVDDSNLNFISSLNSIGIFLSSIGVVVAILTVIQQQYLRNNEIIRQEIKEATVLLFKLRYVITVCDSIKKEAIESVKLGEIFHLLLDGEVEDYFLDLKVEEYTFISRMSNEVYSEICYAKINYNRYISGIFRWQKKQTENDIPTNKRYFNERMENLPLIATPLIDNINNLVKLLKKEYPERVFQRINIDSNHFSNLPRIS
ncbi:hypothetical protein MT390_19515 [Vibrio sp. 2-Bac 85]